MAYLTLDPKGIVTEANAAAALLLDRRTASLIGVPFLALVSVGEGSSFVDHLRRCADERRPVASELAFTTKRGHVETEMLTAPCSTKRVR